MFETTEENNKKWKNDEITIKNRSEEKCNKASI